MLCHFSPKTGISRVAGFGPTLRVGAGRLLAFLLVALVMVSEASAGRTYHVSPEGNDKSGNGSPEKAWRSIQRAADKAKPGDTIVVANGSYGPFHVSRSGTRDAPITIRAAGRNAVIEGYEYYDGKYAAVALQGHHITIEGLHVNAKASESSKRARGIRVSGDPDDYLRGIRILGNKVTGASWSGITTSYAEEVLIEGNEVWGSALHHGIYVGNSADRPVIRANVVHDNSGAGIQINADPELPGDGVITGATVEGNVLYRNGRSGSAALNFASIRDSLIVNNIVYDNYSQGIASWDDEAGNEYGCKNNHYINNTVVMPPGSRHAMSFRHGSTGNVVLNNILIHAGSMDSLSVDRSSLEGFRSDYNIVTRFNDTDGKLIELDQWRHVTLLDGHSFVAEQKDVFVDAAAKDFRINIQSVANDRGIATPWVKHDITGVARPQGPQPDIGAYEAVPDQKRSRR